MGCPHYKSGCNTCVICIHNQVQALIEKRRVIDREVNALLSQIGEVVTD